MNTEMEKDVYRSADAGPMADTEKTPERFRSSVSRVSGNGVFFLLTWRKLSSILMSWPDCTGIASLATWCGDGQKKCTITGLSWSASIN